MVFSVWNCAETSARKRSNKEERVTVEKGGQGRRFW